MKDRGKAGLWKWRLRTVLDARLHVRSVAVCSRVKASAMKILFSISHVTLRE